MLKRWCLLTGGVAFLWVVIGCAGPTPLERDFGNSSRLMRTNQALQREAESLEVVSGLDGKAAEANMEKYRKEFERPSPALPSSLTIGISGSGK